MGEAGGQGREAEAAHLELLVLLAFFDATELELLLLLAAAGVAFAFASSSLLARSLLEASTAAGSRARRTAKRNDMRAC